jgi:type VI secretion system protein VasD
MGRWRIGVLMLGLLGVVGGCSSPPPPPPTVVMVSLKADANDNPTPTGQGAPLVVRIYQLSSDAAFSTAEFFQLFSADQATLKTDLVKKAEYILAPGQTKTATINPTEPVTDIGIFAAYQNYAAVTWRAVVTVAPHQTTKINVEAGAKGIVVKTDPASALKTGS